MPRGTRKTASRASGEEIKAIARQQMVENGTAGISLRGIARELGVTAPAIYNYFPSMDDLITALIVDAFNGLADAIEAAVAAQAPHTIQQLRAGMMAYRTWAIEHPADFQLIYGNPIPGYEAPASITIPLARRPLQAFYTQLLLAWQDGALQIPPEYCHVPQTITTFLDSWLYDNFPELADLPKSLFLLLYVGWARIHGMVMLEIFDHSTPALGDGEAFFQYEVDAFLAQLGLQP